MDNRHFTEQSHAQEHENLQKLIPAVRYIFYAEPRHKRMPLPSGLKHFDLEEKYYLEYMRISQSLLEKTFFQSELFAFFIINWESWTFYTKWSRSIMFIIILFFII